MNGLAALRHIGLMAGWSASFLLRRLAHQGTGLAALKVENFHSMMYMFMHIHMNKKGDHAASAVIFRAS